MVIIIIIIEPLLIIDDYLTPISIPLFKITVR